MADEINLEDPKVKAAIKAALDDAKAEFAEDVEKERAKNAGLLEDLKKAQREARAAKEVTPEQLQAEAERADKAETELTEVKKQVNSLTKERDTAVQAKEKVEKAAIDFARSSEISAAIATSGIVPDLADAYTALIEKGAITELLDGKYVTRFGDKPVGDYVKEHLASDAGKHFKAAAMNGGGGAGGGGGSGAAAKTMAQSQFDAKPAKERAAIMEQGYTLVDG